MSFRPLAALFLLSCMSSATASTDAGIPPELLAARTCQEHVVQAAIMTGDDLPKKARGREYSAVVVVAFRLDGSGLAIDPSVVHSSPAGLFDKTTLELFARTRFAPGVVEGSCHFLRTYSAVLRRKQAN